MDYERRTYRAGHFASPSRISFTCCFRKTDLWISVDRESWNESMPAFCMEQIKEMWKQMEDYLATDPSYVRQLVPYYPREDAPLIFHRMSEASQRTGTGPMSAVAGACAEQIAGSLSGEFPIKELIIENGGDIYARLIHDTDISVFAGGSPLSGKVGLTIPASMTPAGICTSSGTVGPSLSFGKADALMVICHDIALADSYATAYANMIQTPDDIQKTIGLMEGNQDIISAIAIKDKMMGICGKLPLRVFK